ncbi:MAG: DbpA RNA binding domain-containing protein [Steroidobacteraceae bacterium]
MNGLDIQAEHSFVRLPADLLPEVLERLQRVRVRGRELAARVVEGRGPSRPKKAKPHRGRFK